MDRDPGPSRTSVREGAGDLVSHDPGGNAVNAQLALALLALGPTTPREPRTSPPRQAAREVHDRVESDATKPRPGDPIASLAKEWLEKR
jgi:hypothetical protein